jgi:photosystem II stability/assembly factor-like uncharacterized protein
MRISLVVITLLTLVQDPSPEWALLSTGVTARLRGISAVDDRVVWASGADGTIVRTDDGGLTWKTLRVPGAEKLDFRDIDAVDRDTAYVLSIGQGDLSRIYKTSDAGATWIEQFVNREPKAFFDAMDFWDANRGIAVSDSVDGRFVILTTRDGGKTWSRVDDGRMPPALENEGFFAASGTNIATVAPNHVWIGTGAGRQARVLRSSDGGQSWQVSTTPLSAGPSAGIFSIAFSDARHGIVVGGDYKLESVASDNAAATSDGGITWTPVHGLPGFRSAVAHLSRDGASIVAVGPSGGDYSRDRGKTWTRIKGPGFHTFGVARSGTAGYGAGERGSAAKLRW